MHAPFAETDRVTIPLKSLSLYELKRKVLTNKVGGTVDDIKAIENDPQRLSCKCMEHRRYPNDCWLKSRLIALIKAKGQEEVDRKERVRVTGATVGWLCPSNTVYDDVPAVPIFEDHRSYMVRKRRAAEKKAAETMKIKKACTSGYTF